MTLEKYRAINAAKEKAAELKRKWEATATVCDLLMTEADSASTVLADLDALERKVNAAIEKVRAAKTEYDIASKNAAQLEAEASQPKVDTDNGQMPDSERQYKTNTYQKGRNNNMANYEIRQARMKRIGGYLAGPSAEEVSNYSEAFVKAVKTRAFTGLPATIPVDILNEVIWALDSDDTVWAAVRKIYTTNDIKVPITTSLPEPTWGPKCAPVTEASASLSIIELSCKSLSCYIPVCNASILESGIDVVNLTVELLAEGLSNGIDKALIANTADTDKMGAIPAALPAGNKLTVNSYVDFVAAMGNISSRARDVRCVMNRKTYYSFVIPSMINRNISYAVTSVLPDGTPVIIDPNMPDNAALIGDFDRGYRALVKKQIGVSISTEAQFIQRNTVFLAEVLLDGAVVDPGVFVYVTITPGA